MSQQAVIDAWADMKEWVEGTLPSLARGHSVPNQQQDVGEIGACNAFNVPGHEGGGLWGSDGDATVSLSNLSISTLIGVSIQPATFSDATTVHLPFKFTQIEVSGSYSYSQPCAYYTAGHTSMQSSANGHGTISQTVSSPASSAGSTTSAVLTYNATFTDRLTLTGVTVTGDVAANVNPDEGGLPSWLVAIAQFFSTFNEGDALRGTIQSVFNDADFTQVMLQILNQKLGG